MQGLLSRIPGLAQHETVVAPSLDSVEASRLIGTTIAGLNGEYVTGAWDWIRDERPDLHAKVVAAEHQVDAAAKGEDKAALVAALEDLEATFKRAVNAYRGRPPVVPQRELFCVS